MNSKSTEQLLIEMASFSRTQNFSKKATAAKLGIPYGTLKKWFLTSSNRREPSRANVQKIEKFLDSLKETNTRWQELWVKILEWWKTQHRYSTVKEFADEIGWDSQSLAAHLQNGQMPSRLVIEKIAKIIGLETTSLDSILQEAEQKTEKIKYLLLLLEDELRWFRDGSGESRAVFRRSLDLNDVGYISSLLTMLGDEEKFRRWVTLTTNRFSFSKRRGEQK
jgi:hypothetical protein